MKNSANNHIVVPRRTERRFYGHGIPGVDPEQFCDVSNLRPYSLP